MKKNKGITLIALIITIIVMLILVAVSVNVLIKSNLIGTAEKATNKYKTASEEEAKGGSITINGKEYESIDEYIYGATPKLKYVQEGSQIYVYLKGSYYDYIASKDLDEKEQLFAEELGEASIADVIKKKCNNSREEYEKTIQENTGFPYEIGLNSMLVQRKVIDKEEYTTYYIENVLNLKTDEEKEKEFINLIKEIDKEDITIEELRKIINEQVSNGNYTSTTEWLNVFIWDIYTEEGLLELNLITPNGEEQDLGYIQNYISEFNITGANIDYISENNTIKFTAEDYKGRTSELLVPVNIKTFKVKISDTDIRTYKFIDGQTWEQFIGNSGEKTTNDGSLFLTYDTGEIVLRINESTLTYSKLNVRNSIKIASLDKTKIKVADINYKIYGVWIRNENNLVMVKPTDKIVSNTVYEVATLSPR